MKETRQSWPESRFQTPTPVLFQNFRIQLRRLFKFENATHVRTPKPSLRTKLTSCLKLFPYANSCYCRKWKVTPGPEKKQDPAGVDSSTPDPWPPQQLARLNSIVIGWSNGFGQFCSLVFADRSVVAEESPRRFSTSQSIAATPAQEERRLGVAAKYTRWHHSHEQGRSMTSEMLWRLLSHSNERPSWKWNRF